MRVIVFFISAILATGCLSLDDSIHLCADDNGEFHQCTDIELIASTTVKKSPDFQSERSFQTLNDTQIHQNVTHLANNLFSSAKNIKLSQSVAIGTFLPISLNKNPNLAVQHYIGLQIQESFITLATQAGLNVIEFKTASAIEITSDADIMLSRDTNNLTASIQAEYFLTGTYSEHDNKLVVNARIIEFATQKIIAAATGYIPMPSRNDKQTITMKNKMLYRKAL